MVTWKGPKSFFPLAGQYCWHLIRVPSFTLVTMTMVGGCSCQISCQKSTTVFGRGPVHSIMTLSKLHICDWICMLEAWHFDKYSFNLTVTATVLVLLHSGKFSRGTIFAINQLSTKNNSANKHVCMCTRWHAWTSTKIEPLQINHTFPNSIRPVISTLTCTSMASNSMSDSECYLAVRVHVRVLLLP